MELKDLKISESQVTQINLPCSTSLVTQFLVNSAHVFRVMLPSDVNRFVYESLLSMDLH